MTHGDTDQVTHADHQIAEGQVHDGTLRVVEPPRVHQERGEGGGRGEAAEDGPDGQPQLGELSVLRGEEW